MIMQQWKNMDPAEKSIYVSLCHPEESNNAPEEMEVQNYLNESQ